MAAVWLLTVVAALAVTPEGLYRDAKSHEEQGDFSRAIENYRQFLTEYPKHSQVTEARYRLARSQDAIGLIDEAIANLNTVVKKGGDRFRKRADAMFMLGKLLADIERYDESIKIFESLLLEGAGLFHEEVLNRLGGYYAIKELYDEAATKLNILKRRKNSKYAEGAAYKLAMIWIRAGNLDLAVEAVSELAQGWPNNPNARGLMLQIADKFREQRKFAQSIAACEQLRRDFGKTSEGQAAAFVLATVYRDRKELDKAAGMFIEASRLTENRKAGMAAEALVQAADLYYGELNDIEKAMTLYDETTALARKDVSQRHLRILERCYFQLGEHHFRQQKWAVALEYYALLRELGTEVNILPRIMKCQAELGVDLRAEIQNEKEIAFIRKQIADNAGTFAAAEGEVFLIDRVLEQQLDRELAVDGLIEQYRDVLKRYPKTVLAQQHMESYLYTQIGRCFVKNYKARLITITADLEWKSAITSFEKALEIDETTPYRIEILESIANIADLAGQIQRAFEAYQDLYELSKSAGLTNSAGQAASSQANEYMRSMLTRADDGDTVSKALAAAGGIVKREGKDSPAARYATYYIGDLYYIKKDFSAAAKAYGNFIKTYGPPQTAQGDVAGGPWKPARVDEVAEQVYEAALRVAHCWYLQGHTQNMIAAYKWMVRNFPQKNKHIGEAEYWIAMELAKGDAGKTEANRRRLAEQLWKRVVNPSMAFETAAFKKSFHGWTRDPNAKEYAQLAMLKSGELYAGLSKHRIAIDILSTYLQRYPPGRSGGHGSFSRDDELHGVARYALGREYIAIREYTKLIDTYRPYTDGMREDPLRVSALKLLGYHSARNDAFDDGIRAYATLLDEYGRNALDKDDDPIALPRKDWLRKSNPSFNGIRMPPPDELDLGAMRYALGFIYWKLEEWDHAIRVLEPFISDRDLKDNKARAKSLHMVGRCFYRKHDYPRAYDAFDRIVKYPSYASFEAIEEAYVYTARTAIELKKWPEMHALHKKFAARYSDSLSRPHLDLYDAAALIRDGHAVEALPRLAGLLRSDTYQDVKADAMYYLGVYQATKLHENDKAAMKQFEDSIRLYAREESCLEAAKCAMRLERWERAHVFLERTLREFPTGKPRVLKEAARLLPTVMKQLAKLN
jgi:tetratricopeptide (TPR) repeat protein